MADIEHVIAQGQENTARADLTFIEKALFAKRLLSRGMTKDVAKSALTVDDTLLSRMLSVADIVPEVVLEAVGAGKGIGRDRWEELKKLVALPANAVRAIGYVSTDEFRDAQGRGEAFNQLLTHLKSSGKKVRKPKSAPTTQAWVHPSRSLIVTPKLKPKGFSLDLSEKDAEPFGEWLTQNLDDLYQSFRKSRMTSTGD
jgi:ParB family chromosome partitioning protein